MSDVSNVNAEKGERIVESSTDEMDVLLRETTTRTGERTSGIDGRYCHRRRPKPSVTIIGHGVMTVL